MTPEEIKASLKDVITTTIKGDVATDKLHAILQAKMQSRIAPAEVTSEIDEATPNDESADANTNEGGDQT